MVRAWSSPFSAHSSSGGQRFDRHRGRQGAHASGALGCTCRPDGVDRCARRQPVGRGASPHGREVPADLRAAATEHARARTERVASAARDGGRRVPARGARRGHRRSAVRPSRGVRSAGLPRWSSGPRPGRDRTRLSRHLISTTSVQRRGIASDQPELHLGGHHDPHRPRHFCRRCPRRPDRTAARRLARCRRTWPAGLPVRGGSGQVSDAAAAYYSRLCENAALTKAQIEHIELSQLDEQPVVTPAETGNDGSSVPTAAIAVGAISVLGVTSLAVGMAVSRSRAGSRPDAATPTPTDVPSLPVPS